MPDPTPSRSRSLPRALMVRFAAVLIAATAATADAHAQAYPSRAVTLVVPFAAGGGADATGRIIADAMSKHLVQSIVVENVSGAGGAVGSMRVMSARPDGYTIGLGSTGSLVGTVAINPKLKFDSRQDFDYLGIVNTTPNVVFVRNSLPVRTMTEFIAYARIKGRDLKFGHSGIGAASHMTCALLFKLIGADPTHVIYRGYGQTINDILSGSIDGSCDLVSSASGHITGAAVRALALADVARSAAVPNIPNANEVGLPEFKAETWMALFLPKGTPTSIQTRLGDALAKSLSEPGVSKRFADIGATVPSPDRQGGEYLRGLIVSEVGRWKYILKQEMTDPQQ